RIEPDDQLVPGIVSGCRLLRDRPRGLGAHLDEHSLKELLLAAGEVVIEGAPRDPGPLDDLLCTDPRVPLLGEQFAAGADQRGDSRPTLLRLGSGPLATVGVLVDICLDIHTVCM